MLASVFHASFRAATLLVRGVAALAGRSHYMREDFVSENEVKDCNEWCDGPALQHLLLLRLPSAALQQPLCSKEFNLQQHPIYSIALCTWHLRENISVHFRKVHGGESVCTMPIETRRCHDVAAEGDFDTIQVYRKCVGDHHALVADAQIRKLVITFLHLRRKQLVADSPDDQTLVLTQHAAVQ